MRRIFRVKPEAGTQQGVSDGVAQMTQCRARERSGRYDFKVDVFRHAPDETVCPAQGRAAAQHQAERCGAGRADRRDRLDDMPILFNQGGAWSAKSFCASSKSWRDGLSLKHQLQVAVTEPPRETSLHPHHRIDRHLSGAAFVVGAFRIGRFPGDSQLGERLPGGAEESIRAVEQRN